MATGAALVLLVALIWSARGTTGQPVADGAGPVQLPVGPDGQGPVSGPTPTVRWETPPKFGGRGGDYSVAPAPLRLRPGPYR